MMRREFLQVGAMAMIGAGQKIDARQKTGAQPDNHLTSVKALVFDVFGTVVDWRTSVSRDVEELARRKGLKIDGVRFADAWRAGYGPSMNRVRNGELPWTRLDELHRMILDKILIDFGFSGLSETEIERLNRAWHRLQPWPDTVAGLTRLKKKFILAPLSNGNIALMTDLAKYSGLPWDCILGAELVRHYKPDHEVYDSAAYFLNIKPAEVLMVAAHLGDLRGAKAAGLSTAFVPRPLEFGPNGKPDLKPDPSVDLTAKDFNDLASRLGA